MKKLIMMVAAAFVMTAAMAQQNNGERNGRTFDKSEMVQKRTDRMVENYGLNKEQAQKLLELNKSYMDKMPRMGGPRGNRNESAGENKQRPDMSAMKAAMDEYETNLKSIMTEEQYKKYSQDKASRMNRGGGARGNRDRN